MSALEVTEVGDGLWAARTDFVNWYVVVDGASVLLVDCGYPGQFDAVEESVRRAGAQPSDVRQLLVTHAHVDHIGSMPQWISRHGVPVLAGPAELSNLRGETSESATPLDVVKRAWRPRVASWGLRISRLGASSHPHTDAAIPVDAGVPLDLPGRPVAVPLPGHTSGHTAYYFPDHGAVITGDALVTGHSLSATTGPQLLAGFFHHDEPELRRTLPELARLDADLILPGHGAPTRTPIAEAVEQALRS